MLRKTAFLAVTALLLFGFATSVGARGYKPRPKPKVVGNDICKVSCSTETGWVIGGDGTNLKDELPKACDRGAPCNVCLHALIRKGYAFDNTVIPGSLFIPTGPRDDPAVLYQLVKPTELEDKKDEPK